jgi:hypothetical protein
MMRAFYRRRDDVGGAVPGEGATALVAVPAALSFIVLASLSIALHRAPDRRELPRGQAEEERRTGRDAVEIAALPAELLFTTGRRSRDHLA